MYLYKKGYNTLVVGDLTGYREDNDKGSTRNQENHSWLYSQISWYLKYKALKLGLKYFPQEESYTSRMCPICGYCKSYSPKGRVFKCSECGFVGHRDLVGAWNILNKYLGIFGLRRDFVLVQEKPVDGFMAQPLNIIRYKPNIHVAHGFDL